jgi:formylglycine-generating enzyme required for sulfatase activity
MLPGDVSLEMVYIPAGTFMMGRYPGEQDSSDWEDPRHQVTVPGFWMSKYEITKAQWTAIMDTTPWAGQDDVLDELDSPAVYVSWNDARAFITALSNYAGKRFRLPSESEWEYACRAGTTTRLYWGNDPEYTEGDAYCWWWYNAAFVDEAYAHASGVKLPNAFELYDMSGNVWEWCEDDWHGDYVGAPTDGRPWVKSPRGTTRVLRGGSWLIHGNNARSANRNHVDPAIKTPANGFRIAR